MMNIICRMESIVEMADATSTTPVMEELPAGWGRKGKGTTMMKEQGLRLVAEKKETVFGNRETEGNSMCSHQDSQKWSWFYERNC
jgi:hypothetical protein